MVAEVTKEEALELLDRMIKTALDPDSVSTQELEQEWPNERIAQCLEAIQAVIARPSVNM